MNKNIEQIATVVLNSNTRENFIGVSNINPEIIYSFTATLFKRNLKVSFIVGAPIGRKNIKFLTLLLFIEDNFKL